MPCIGLRARSPFVALSRKRNRKGCVHEWRTRLVRGGWVSTGLSGPGRGHAGATGPRFALRLPLLAMAVAQPRRAPPADRAEPASLLPRALGRAGCGLHQRPPRRRPAGAGRAARRAGTPARPFPWRQPGVAPGAGRSGRPAFAEPGRSRRRLCRRGLRPRRPACARGTIGTQPVPAPGARIDPWRRGGTGTGNCSSIR